MIRHYTKIATVSIIQRHYFNAQYFELTMASAANRVIFS